MGKYFKMINAHSKQLLDFLKLAILFLKHFFDTKMLQVNLANYPPMTASLVFSSLWRDDGLVQVCSGLSGTSAGLSLPVHSRAGPSL